MERVYAGLMVGEHTPPRDMGCNPTKAKKLSNLPSATKETMWGSKSPEA